MLVVGLADVYFPNSKARTWITISKLTFKCSINVVYWIDLLLYSSSYTGFYLLSRIEALADKKVYGVNRYFISGHSLEHLCLAMVPLILSIMLWLRSIRIARYFVLLCLKCMMLLRDHSLTGIGVIGCLMIWFCRYTRSNWIVSACKFDWVTKQAHWKYSL